MARYNNGTIFTNDKCTACNKCVDNCPVKGANVTAGLGENRKIMVDEKKCTNCGTCIKACNHEARDYKDDLTEVLNLLKEGAKVSVVVDAAFLMFYGDVALNALGYLEKKGVQHFYDTGYGTEISIWAHAKFLKKNKDTKPEEKAFIINSCPAVVDAIEKYHPTLLTKLIPVHSPTACMMIYARKYLKDKNKLVYLGPCTAKMNEAEALPKGYQFDYFISSQSLMKYLKERDISNLSRKPDLSPIGMGRLVVSPNTFIEGLSLFFHISEKLVAYSGMNDENFGKLEMVCKPGYESMQPLAAEFWSCREGCLYGPEIEKDNYDPVEIYTRYNNARNYDYDTNDKLSEREQIWEQVDTIQEKQVGLKFHDFIREFADKYKQPLAIPKATYNEIFDAMLKDTEQKRHLDCGSCGYNTCKEMARAIAMGYSRKENCIHYMNDVMMQKYMYNKITNLYNNEIFFTKVMEIIRNNPGKKYFLCVGNINKLGIINDLYGYLKGDAVLKLVAENIKKLTPDDGVCAYFGGGNYIMFMEYRTDLIEAIQKVEYFDVSELGIDQRVTMRFGVYVLDDPSINISAVVNYSFMAAKRNVSAGRNTITFFTTELRTKISYETEMLSKLQKAISDEEFSIMLRPQYNLKTRELVGAEARAYWVNKEGEYIPYEEYVTLAEKNGLIQSMDYIMWKKAFEMIRRLLDMGLEPPRIDVNFTMPSALDEKTVEIISTLRDKYNISNHYVRFVISERSYKYDPVTLALRVKFLKKTGFQMAISDFGIGSGSIAAFLEKSFDMVRVNLEFIKGTEDNDRSGAVLTALARVAQDVAISAEADNIETEAQASFLKSVGIIVGQGKLFSPDLNEHEFVNLIKNVKSTVAYEKVTSVGKIDIGRFYEPSSYESIMFESFSGPAFIAELDEEENTFEIVRINNKAITLFGGESRNEKEMQDLFDQYLKGRGKDIITQIKENVNLEEDLELIFPINEKAHNSEKWVKAEIKELSRIDQRHMLYLQLEDVTGEQLIERALDLSNRQMANFMEAETCGNCLIHVHKATNPLDDTYKMSVVYANPDLCKLLGYKEGELAGWSERDIHMSIHPLERQNFIKEFDAAVTDESGKLHSIVCRIQNKSGYFKKVRLAITSLKTADGTNIAYVNIVGA